MEVFKPAAPVRWHLFLAAMLWSVVGTLLLFFGARWVLGAGWPFAGLFILAALAAGTAKARLVLDRTARRIVDRIRSRGDGRCLGGFLSVRTWLFVGVMAGGGRMLRGGVLPRGVVGLIYVAVGAALLLGARHPWRAWHNEQAAPR